MKRDTDSPTHTAKGTRLNTRWIVKCDCGNVYSIAGDTLRNKSVKQCRKCVSIFNDITDKTFGNLKVVKYAGKYVSPGGSKHHRWTVLCKCQNVFDVNAGHLLSGATKRCKSCNTDSQKLNGKMSSRAFVRISRGAARRHIKLEVDRQYLQQLFDIQKGICPYSGVVIGFSSTVAEAQCGGDTASLDRKNSAIGYVEGNIQWVHKVVNIMKARLTETEFLLWCQLIVNHSNTTNLIKSPETAVAEQSEVLVSEV